MSKNELNRNKYSHAHSKNRLLIQCLLTCAFLFIIAHKANAACMNWSTSMGRADQSLIFHGTIGGHPVRMMLHYDNATNSFDGAYGYSNQPGVLRLSGHMRRGNTGVYLTGQDGSGRITGYFHMRFMRPREPWESAADYASTMEQLGCSFLTGTWTSPSGKKVESVSLPQDGVIDPSFDRERAVNEVVAYKLRLAMLNGDTKLFASLLNYPFYSENGMQVPTEWKTPQDVINNYDKIMTFSSDTVRNAVPHVLETAVKTVFMNGSIFIKGGKVTRICDEACANTSP